MLIMYMCWGSLVRDVYSVMMIQKIRKKVDNSDSKTCFSMAKMKPALDFPCDICPRYWQHIECLGHFEVEIIDSLDSSVRQTRSRESQRSYCWQNPSN